MYTLQVCMRRRGISPKFKRSHFPEKAITGLSKKVVICPTILVCHFPENNLCQSFARIFFWQGGRTFCFRRGRGINSHVHPSWGSKTSPLPSTRKMGTHHQKILDQYSTFPPLFWLLYCACIFFHEIEKLQQLAEDWKNHCLFSSKQLFSYICKFFGQVTPWMSGKWPTSNIFG